MNKNIGKKKCEIFIIPNTPGKMDEFLFPQIGTRVCNFFQKLAELNGMNFDDWKNDKLVQLWYVESSDSEDRCEDMYSHTFEIVSGETTYNVKLGEEFLPETLVKELKEGDTISLEIPLTEYNSKYFKSGIKSDEELSITCEITARQLKYRYRNFGTFEETLHTLEVI